MNLDELIDELQDLAPEEKLEWLVEFAGELPELSAERRGSTFPETCRVQECQTPVFLWVDVADGRIRLEADVSERSPIVRGLVALVVVGLNGAPVSTGLDVPDDLLSVLGLTAALGMTRQQGFRGVVSRVKRELLAASEPAAKSPSCSREK
jgi:cysteine desulfuration protein SufE